MRFTNIKDSITVRRADGTTEVLHATGDGGTDDTRAIQAHIDNVKDTGGTVYFPPGDYLVSQSPTERSRCLELCSNVTYLGSGRSSRVVLKEDQPNSVRMFSTAPNGAHHVTVRNLHLDGNRDRQKPKHKHLHAIFLQGAHACLVEGCVIHDTVGDGIYGYLGEEPSLPGCPFPRTASTNLSVSRNEFYNIGRVGVNFAGASFSEASGNFFYDPTRRRPFWAFKMEINNNFKPEGYPGYAVNFLRGNKFIGNRMRDVGGLAVSSSRDVKAVDLLFADNVIEFSLAEAEFLIDAQQVPVILSGVIGAQLSGNVISRPGTAGILIYSSEDVLIERNTIAKAIFARESRDGAIIATHHTSDGSLPPSRRVRIIDNLLVENKGHGLSLDKCDGMLILNNRILNNGGDGISLYLGAREYEMSFSHSLLQNNRIVGNQRHGIFVEGGARVNNICENLIKSNGQWGVVFRGGSGVSASAGNRLRRNRLESNAAGGLWLMRELGEESIDLGTAIVAPDDLGYNCFVNNGVGMKNESTVRVKAYGNYWDGDRIEGALERQPERGRRESDLASCDCPTMS